MFKYEMQQYDRSAIRIYENSENCTFLIEAKQEYKMREIHNKN